PNRWIFGDPRNALVLRYRGSRRLPLRLIGFSGAPRPRRTEDQRTRSARGANPERVSVGISDHRSGADGQANLLLWRRISAADALHRHPHHGPPGAAAGAAGAVLYSPEGD